jgi:c-di-GMP-binding flagellar brake protein YcgR
VPSCHAENCEALAVGEYAHPFEVNEVVERRSFTRVASQLEAVCERSGEVSVGILCDLTLEGAFLRSDAAAKAGDEVQLKLLGNPDSDAVVLRARVVRRADRGERRGYGIRFLGMDPRARQAIANYLLVRLAPRSRNSQ